MSFWAWREHLLLIFFSSTSHRKTMAFRCEMKGSCRLFYGFYHGLSMWKLWTTPKTRPSHGSVGVWQVGVVALCDAAGRLGARRERGTGRACAGVPTWGMWGFHGHGGTPKAGWFSFGKKPENGWFGGTSILGNLHVMSSLGCLPSGKLTVCYWRWPLK